MKKRLSLLMYFLILFFSSHVVIADEYDAYEIPYSSSYKYGVMNSSGKLIVSAKYSYIGNYHNGLAKAKDSLGWLYIDTSGREVFRASFCTEVGDFHDGLAKAKDSVGWKFYNTSGKEVFRASLCTEVGDFHDGLVKAKDNVGWKYYNTNGREVFRTSLCTEVGDFHDGLAKAKDSIGWKFYNTSGNEVFRASLCTEVGDFHEGLVKAKDNVGWKYYNTNGREVFRAALCTEVGDFHDGLVKAKDSVGWKFYNTSGKEVFRVSLCTEVGDFHEGLAKAKDSVGWKYYNTSGNEAFRASLCTDAGDFYNCLVRVKDNLGWKFYNTSGKEAFRVSNIDVVSDCCNGYVIFASKTTTNAPTHSNNNNYPNNYQTSGSYGDNISFVFSGNTLSFYGSGAMRDLQVLEYAPWESYKNEIVNIIIGEGITHIGDNSFAFCDSLVNVSLPSTLSSVGNAAFMSCAQLSSVNLPNSIIEMGTSVFSYCDSLSNVNIPTGLYYVPSAMLEGTAISSIYIPNNIQTIGFSAFGYCNNLENVELPNSITKIMGCAFSGCKNLKTINIPPKTTDIADDIFYSTDNVTVFVSPNSYAHNFMKEKYPFLKCEVSTANIFVFPNNNQPMFGKDEQQIGLSVTDTKVYLNGEQMSFSVPVLSMRDRTLVPMRDLFEALGVEVIWNGENRTITTISDTKTMVMTIGENVVKSYGAPILTDVAPIIYNSKTMVPLRFVCEQLHLNVEWDGTTNSVILTSKGKAYVDIEKGTIYSGEDNEAERIITGEVINGKSNGMAKIDVNYKNSSYTDSTFYACYSDNKVLFTCDYDENGQILYIEPADSGYAYIRFKNGDYYIGDFSENKRNGYGTYYWADGTYQMGYYKDDKSEGYFTRYLPNGTYINLFYENNNILYSQGMNDEYSITY